MPEFSIIVPIYKVEKYLEICIDSIIGQSFCNFELILVDDGSPDTCGEICDRYSSSDTRVKVVHKENGGLSSARNAGLDIATGKYVIFIDSDDFWDDASALEHIHINLTETDADVLVFTAKRYYESEDKYTYSPRVYNSYLHYLERKMKSKIKEFIFRDKIGGWHKHVEKIIYENGKIEYRDGYTQLFYTNLPLRRSCGECPFSTIKRCGDFTVGDFWGVQDVLPEFDDNKGVSLLFFNNDRALERFDSFKEMLKYQEISVTDAVRQPNLKGHSVIPKNVNAFWRDFQKKGIGYCISFYSPAGIPFRIKRKIKYIYSKVTRK